MLAEMGVDEPGLDVLARVGFDTLGLQTYLTAGPKESRAWTIRKGATAPEAAGVIHTDFQRGFIKAEIVSYDDLMAAGSMAQRPRRPARCGWRARTTSCRTATWSSSASTSDPWRCRRGRAKDQIGQTQARPRVAAGRLPVKRQSAATLMTMLVTVHGTWALLIAGSGRNRGVDGR